MKKQHAKKQISPLNRLLAKALLGIILIFMFSPAAFAAEPIKCANLNYIDSTDPAKQKEADANAKKMEDYIVTILEEEIGGTNKTSVTPSDKAAESMICFRETKCDTTGSGDKQKTTCVSSYADKCSPQPNKVFCQRVQVLISQSGIDLLMSYLGIIYQWAASVIGIVSVAYLIYGGFLIGTAQDDTSKIDKAKEKIFQSIAGLVLLFLSAIILYTINPNFFTI